VSRLNNGEHISCVGGSDGAAIVNASSGIAPYTYAWSTLETTQEITGLSAGTYTVTVADQNGCTATSSVTLNDPPALTATAYVTSNYFGAEISCPGALDGSVYVEASGGTIISDYAYRWNTGFLGDSLINIGANTYTVTVTDANNCEVVTSVTINNPTPLDATIAIDSNYNGFDVSCVGENDGGLTANTTGGTGAYSYLWDGGQTTPSITDATSGTTTVTITDVNGCSIVRSVTLDEPSDLTFTAEARAPQDCGVNDGIIRIDATGGVGNYEYSIDGINWQSDKFFSGLAPGTYFTHVRNEFGTCEVGPQSVTVDVTEAPTIANVTIIHPTTNVSTDGGILVGGSGNAFAFEFRLVGVTGWQSSNLFENLSVGTYDIELRYVGQTCIATSTVTLVAGKGVESSGSTLSFCSGDVSATNFVETYYLPAPEDEVLQALQSIYPENCRTNTVNPIDPVQNYVSIGVVEGGTIIHYDHWEDGYEPNLSFPVQPTTEIWGDGILTNGSAPGDTDDFLSAAEIIVLNNLVYSRTMQDVLDYDGGDKVGSRGNLGITKLNWASGSTTFFAGALEVYPIESWGLEYQMPVGEDRNVNNMFEYTGAVVMAQQNGTTVNYIDNGTAQTRVLAEGESFLIDGNIDVGDLITADQLIQVHLLTGDICAHFESRFFTLKPTEQWSNSYYSPVSTVTDSIIADSTIIAGHPTLIHFYNPNTTPIRVFYETLSGINSINILPNEATEVTVPEDSGVRTYSENDENYYAIATIDRGATPHDWGYALIPADQLTSQITIAGFAPGQDPTYCFKENIIAQSGWTLISTSSDENASLDGAKAFDGDLNTFWHTQFTPTSPTHPHDIRIDLGASYNLSQFLINPRATYQTFTQPNDLIIPNAGPITVTSTLNVTATGTIEDLNLADLRIDHTFLGYLRVQLQSPSGTIVTIFDQDCGPDGHIDITFDNDVLQSYPCPPIGGGTFLSGNPLSYFNGEEMNGTWSLILTEPGTRWGGTLRNWSLEINGGTSSNGNIEDYDFYITNNLADWGDPIITSEFDGTPVLKKVVFEQTNGRYIRLVANSEINGGPWTTIAELNVVACETQPNIENSAPIWITADYPEGSTSTGNIRICVDHDGNGGTFVDAFGTPYDEDFFIPELGQIKLYDTNDNDQTGTRIWVCDNSDAIIAGAWGQDPETAVGGLPAIDLGVGLPNGIPFSISKCADLSKDINGNGLFDECDEVLYTIMIRNTGALPLSVGTLTLLDTLPEELTYIDGSTNAIIGNNITTLSDDPTPFSSFPLDEQGYHHGSVILPNDSILFQFSAVIDDLTDPTFVRNVGTATNNGASLQAEVTFPVQTPISPIIDIIGPDTILSCENIIVAAVQDSCFQEGLLPEYNWTSRSVDSQQGPNFGGEEAIDGNRNTYWLTSSSAPTSCGVGNATDATANTGVNNPDNADGNFATLDDQGQVLVIDLGEIIAAGTPYTIRLRRSPVTGGTPTLRIAESGDGVNYRNRADNPFSTNNTSFYNYNLVTEYDTRFVRFSNLTAWDLDIDAIEFQCCCTGQVPEPLPHAIQIDLGQTEEVSGFTYLPRQDNSEGRIADYEFYLSMDGTNWGSPVATGTWTSGTDPETVSFPSQTANYVQLRAISEVNGGGLTAVAELVVSGCIVNTTFVETNTQTNNGTCTDQAYNITRTWTTTDYCGNVFVETQNIIVVDTTAPVLLDIPADLAKTPSGIPEPPLLNCGDNVTNIALGKPATQSSLLSSTTPASRLVDGIYSNFNTTSVEVEPWWEVDLLAVHQLDSIHVFNRTNCCQPRTENYYILVSEKPFTSTDLTTTLSDPKVHSYFEGPQAQFPTTIPLSSFGRYVRIQLQTGDIMNIAEVEIFPRCINAVDNCDPDPVVTFAENITTTGCSYEIERTWTATDNCGNTSSQEQTIFVETTLDIDALALSNITCNGDNDGEAIVEVSGGIAPITILWSDGQTMDTVRNLIAGTYFVTVTDNLGCSALDSITLSQPPPTTITTSITSNFGGEAINCAGENSGSVRAMQGVELVGLLINGAMVIIQLSQIL